MNQSPEDRHTRNHRASPTTAADLSRVVGLGQALYYIATGVWSLVSIDTFQKVTGPKTDLWLVKTVGVLVIVIGGVVGIGSTRRSTGPEIPMLAVGSAAGLTAIDVVYVAKRRIAPIYLLDALGEIALIIGWAMAWRQRSR